MVGNGPENGPMSQDNPAPETLDQADQQQLRWEAQRLLKLLDRIEYIEGDYLTITRVEGQGKQRREKQISRMYRREPSNRQTLLCQTPIRKHLETQGPSGTFRIRVWRFKGKRPAGGVHCPAVLDGFPAPEMPPEASVAPQEEPTKPKKPRRRSKPKAGPVDPGETAKLQEENSQLRKELHTLRWEVQTLRRQLRVINHHLNSLESSLEPGTEPA